MDEILRRIFIQKNNFYKQTGLEPNIIILNRDDYYGLIESNEFLNSTKLEETPTAFGLKIEVKDKGNLQVGYVMEEYTPNQ